MNILIFGGCGYTGTILFNKLSKNKSYNITVYDTHWFGNYLKSDKNVKIIKGDIRNFDDNILKNCDVVFHLANIANDPAVDLNPELSWEVNVLATMKILESCIKHNVKQFIYASSGSVYGIKDEEQVTEELDLVPISTYNKTKMISERVILSYSKKILTHIIRPATVCGYSPRMRLDVSVNLLTYQALTRKAMTILGGTQIRPNIHIEDLADVYIHFLNNFTIASGCYNAGFENISIEKIARKIIEFLPNVKLDFKKSNDQRSYRLNSDKLKNTGFLPKKNVNNAIHEIINEFKSGNIKGDETSYTIEWMKKINISI